MRWYLFVLLGVAVGPACWGLDSEAAMGGETARFSEAGFRFTSTTQEVRLSFTVKDEAGRPASGLNKDDLVILDNRHTANQVRSFVQEHDLPLRVVFLIDGSSSLRDWVKVEQEGVAAFMRRLEPGTDAAASIVFADAGNFERKMSQSGSELIKNVDVRTSPNITALYDVLFRASAALGDVDDTTLVRRALVVISDGEDNASMYGVDQVIAEAQRHDVSIYTVGMKDPRSTGSKILKLLSSQTGAESYFPRTPRELQGALSAIESELRSQYTISFVPPEKVVPGSFHPIQVKVPGHEQYSVNVRAGYFVPAEH